MSHPNPAIVQLRIRRNGTHLWVNYPNVGVDEHADAQSIEALKKRWMQWPELYQVPSGLPYHVDTWREEDWLLYFKKQEEEETVVSKEVTVGLSKEAQPVEKYKERDVCDLERYPGMLI